jgi:hypothetical protein
MSTFDSTKTALGKLLDEIIDGDLQLPDFQRGWVWDDEHIRSLLVSIARSFPIGAIMLLETGGEARFQVRPVEGVLLSGERPAERLILDGQQRLTSLTQVVRLKTPVATRDEKKRELKRFYYFDIARALLGVEDLEEAIVAVDESRTLKANFGRDVILDISTPEKEYATFHFPCNQILNSDAWEEGLNAAHPERLGEYMKFRQQVLNPFRNYLIPVIELKKETTKEAVCLVFERVNTGGVSLSVFELVTAAYAADGFNLRRDWFGEGKFKGRVTRWADKPLLKSIAATDFLQGVSLLFTYERQQQDLLAGKMGKELTAVSAKREHILSMPLDAYQKWAEPLTKGLLETEQFLRHLGFHHPKFLPYRAQLIPLACVLVHLGDRWLEPQIQDKLTRWYWCGVFGELYGSASETRIALDLQHLLQWVNNPAAPVPATIVAAGFQASRLDTLRTRTSAAYRGLYVLLQQTGAKDFFWKARIADIDRNEKGIDIHHIFPRKWCEDHGISPRIYNAIINKTAISAKANRKIGGNAPSIYLNQLQTDAAVQLDDAAMDEILRSHEINPRLLRADEFDEFFQTRKAALLAMVEKVMGKQAVTSQEPPPEDGIDEEDDEDDDERDEIEMSDAGDAAQPRAEGRQGRRQRISSSDFIGLCPPDTQALLTSVIQAGAAAGYKVKWNTRGFSFRLNLPEGRRSVFYGFPPGVSVVGSPVLEAYTGYLDDPSARQRIETLFLAVPGFVRATDKTFRCVLNDSSSTDVNALTNALQTAARELQG